MTTSTMYSTCLFCQSTLGENSVVAAFPVGRRLAFDAERGRLWVICLHCSQWNLTPLEERWEAVEQCERLFRDTRVRVSTDEIGLARVREGLDLVRVGRPLRPEFAAWRYGPQLGRRRYRAIAATGAAVIVGGAALAGGAMAGLLSVVPAAVVGMRGLPEWLMDRRVVARIPAGNRWAFVVRAKHLQATMLHAESDEHAWSLDLRHDGGERRFSGSRGVRATGHLMAGINRFGASARQVDSAVSLLEQAGDPQRYVAHVARRARQLGNLAVMQLPTEVRLAIEMSAHEEAERRALEGELTALREAWEQAEAVAKISDNLLLPPEVDTFLREHGRGPGAAR